MKVAMVIPSYWSRERGIGWRGGDAIYDHPTPLDEDGTLFRTLKSMRILNDRDFLLVIIAVATSYDIADKVERKVRNIVESADLDMHTIVFGASHLREIHDLMRSDGLNDETALLKLRGYSNIRNLCVFIPHVLGMDVAVLIDDDEVFEDADFIAKATEFIGRRIDGGSSHIGMEHGGDDKRGERVLAVAGFYVNEDGSYLIKKEMKPWMREWNQYECMNEAFRKIIGSPPRLKETPFVFGGNMVIHRDMWMKIPFDPNVPRGEDIDYLINARMFGFRFFLDNKLSIKHLPPPKAHPEWLQLRLDICRFVYERAKIAHQKRDNAASADVVVNVEDFDPYPGCFLRHDLDDKIANACRLLSAEYLMRGDLNGAEEALRNIRIAQQPRYNVFQWLCNLQRRWEALMRWAESASGEMQQILYDSDAAVRHRRGEEATRKCRRRCGMRSAFIPQSRTQM